MVGFNTLRFLRWLLPTQSLCVGRGGGHTPGSGLNNPASAIWITWRMAFFHLFHSFGPDGEHTLVSTSRGTPQRSANKKVFVATLSLKYRYRLFIDSNKLSVVGDIQNKTPQTFWVAGLKLATPRILADRVDCTNPRSHSINPNHPLA